jgi:regulatory protein
MQEFNPNDMRLVAMNLLATREYLRDELARKLYRKFGGSQGCDDESPVEELLDQLVAENLLSDERYAESYIRSRCNRGYGPDRIRQELRQKGVDSGLLASALSAAEVDWAAQAREVRCKKFGGTAPRDFKDRARQLRFLTYRGFGSECAAAALEDADQDF